MLKVAYINKNLEADEQRRRDLAKKIRERHTQNAYKMFMQQGLKKPGKSSNELAS